MRYLLVLLFGFLILNTGHTFTVTNVDLGEIRQFEVREAELLLTNNSGHSITAHPVHPARQGDYVSLDNVVLQPGESRSVTARVNGLSDSGRAVHSFEFVIDGESKNKVIAQVHMFVTSILDNPRQKIDFGVVQSSDPMPVKILEPFTSELGTLKAEKIISAPPFVDAKIDSRTNSVSVALKGRQAWGRRQGTIKIALASKVQPEVWIDIDSNIVGEVYSNADPYNLGVVRAGAPHEFLIELRGKNQSENLQLGSIRVENIAATAQSGNCAPNVPSCRLIHLKTMPEQTPGFVRGIIYVELPRLQLTLPIHVGGVVISKDMQIRSLDEQLKNQSTEQNESSSTARINLEKALASATDRDTAPRVINAESGNGPLLTWVIANGEALYGFTVWRSQSESGSFKRINENVVKAIPDKQEITYKFRDNSAKAGETYWYYIGLIYNDGHKQQLSGPQKVVAK